MTARHWFHCSHTCHGERWEAVRRPPQLRGPGEPDTPRLCVGPSVAACFAAHLFYRDVYVYRTEKPRRAVAPVEVNDSIITGERWLIPPVVMVLTHVIPERVALDATVTIRAYLHTVRKPPTHVQRLQAFAQAIDVLGRQSDEFVDRRERLFVTRALAHFAAPRKAAAGAEVRP